ncbi:hypothetical protein [Pseudorhodoferax sp. Leaf274]|uniref:hypothetical protein n=1 Tax=Pseudorhodoferax sp. Leaf274 TaxID=1736318 RepID=UPI0012E1C5DC|nr:hypothetical protein [Pseudorhodoferax sp. Leaf274]
MLLVVAGAAVLLAGLIQPAAMRWAMLVLYVALGFGALHAVLAFIHKCPMCAKRPMVEGFTQIHPDAVSQSKLRGWAGVAWNVHRNQRFVCIHCGTPFKCDL